MTVFNRRLIPLALLIICFLIVAAIGNKLRDRGNFARVTIQAGDELTLTFLRQHLRGREACEAAAASVAELIVTNCPLCRVTRQECLSQLNDEQSTLFSNEPVPYPTARLHGGIMAYQAADPKTALATCRLSEQRSPRGLVICSPPNTPRPLPAKLQQRLDSQENAFLGLAWLAALLFFGIALYLARQCRHHHNASSEPRRPYNPWPAKMTLAAGDTLIMIGTFLAIDWPNGFAVGHLTPIERNTLLVHVGLMAITILWFWVLLEHYARRRPIWDELKEIARVITAMFIVAGATIFLAGVDSAPLVQLSLWLSILLMIPIGRRAFRGVLDCLGLWQMPTVIIGAGDNARDAATALASEGSMGYHVIAFIDVEGNQHSAIAGKAKQPLVPVIPCSITHAGSMQQQLDNLLSEQGQPQIVIALDNLNTPESQKLVQYLSTSARNIHIIPAIRGLPLFGTQASHFFSQEVLLLTVRNNLSRRTYRWVKRGFDLVSASLLLLLLSPLLLVLSALIRRNGVTAFYGHSRVGQNGKPFQCLKFRSMRPDADKVLKELLKNDPVARSEWDKDFKLKNDPRITAVGQFLRKTSLDELPQLINVVKGDMSLVGPRPIVEAELPRYGDQVGLYLQSKPGITGLWQISGRNDTTYTGRVALDAWYVQNWSLWYDIAILFKTVEVVFHKRGAY